MNNTIFYLVRHGETDWNKEDRLQGHTDRPLNEKGLVQAKEIAESLKEIHFDEIFSSDLSRAIKTAEAVALDRKMTVKATEALREKTYGKQEGRSAPEVVEELKDLIEKWKLLSDHDKLYFNRYNSGETDGEAVERFMRHLRELALSYPSKTILIASHGGIMKYLLIKLGWGTYKELHRDAIKNTGYIVLESDGVDFFIKETVGVTKIKE